MNLVLLLIYYLLLLLLLLIYWNVLSYVFISLDGCEITNLRVEQWQNYGGA